MAAVIESEVLRGKAAASHDKREKVNDMDDVIRRLGIVESTVGELRAEVSGIGADVQAIKAVLPHLATKTDVSELRAEMNKSFGELRAEMNKSFGELRAEMNKSFGEMYKSFGDWKWSMVIWFVGTSLTSAGLAFTVAKLIS